MPKEKGQVDLECKECSCRCYLSLFEDDEYSIAESCPIGNNAVWQRFRENKLAARLEDIRVAWMNGGVEYGNGKMIVLIDELKKAGAN